MSPSPSHLHSAIESSETEPSSASTCFGVIEDCEASKMPANAINCTAENGRKVRFRNEAQCCNVPHRSDLSEEIIANTWYQPSDYAAIRAENECIVSLMETSAAMLQSHGDNIHSGISGRGLEYKIKEIGEQRIRSIRVALAVVLEEQDRLLTILNNKENHDTANFIAESYMEFTIKCKRAAHKRALEDELEARRIFAMDSPSRVALSTPSPRYESMGISAMPTYTPRCTSNRRRHRSVTFNPKAYEKEIRHVNEYTEQEITDLFYSYEEIKAIKAKNKMVVNILVSRSFVEDDEYVLRGLETLIPQRSKIKKQTKYAALLSVLDEQDRQDMMGGVVVDTDDAEQLLADVYIPISTRCRKAAFQRAKMDEDAITSYMGNVHTYWRNNSNINNAFKNTTATSSISLNALPRNAASDNVSKHAGVQNEGGGGGDDYNDVSHLPSALRKRIDLTTAVTTPTTSAGRTRIARQA